MCERTQQAGHMDASDLIKPLQDTLQGGGRPHMSFGGAWAAGHGGVVRRQGDRMPASGTSPLEPGLHVVADSSWHLRSEWQERKAGAQRAPAGRCSLDRSDIAIPLSQGHRPHQLRPRGASYLPADAPAPWIIPMQRLVRAMPIVVMDPQRKIVPHIGLAFRSVQGVIVPRRDPISSTPPASIAGPGQDQIDTVIGQACRMLALDNDIEPRSSIFMFTAVRLSVDPLLLTEMNVFPPLICHPIE
jgi:hypothetical protein